MDLNNLSLDELKGLHARTSEMIKGFEDRKRDEAYREIEARARELGFSLSDLIKVKSKGHGPTSTSPARYKNPVNQAETWSGRGRHPKWFDEAIANGITPDSMEL